MINVADIVTITREVKRKEEILMKNVLMMAINNENFFGKNNIVLKKDNVFEIKADVLYQIRKIIKNLSTFENVYMFEWSSYEMSERRFNNIKEMILYIFKKIGYNRHLLIEKKNNKEMRSFSIYTFYSLDDRGQEIVLRSNHFNGAVKNKTNL